MQKRAVLALMLALTLILSGCALIEKDAAVDAETEIIRLGDQVMKKGEVKEQINQVLNFYQMVYGVDTSSEEMLTEVRTNVVEQLKSNMATKAKAAELKLDQLTEEEETKLKTDAEADYQSQVDSKVASYTDEGLTDEEKQARAIEELTAAGTTVDSLIKTARETLINDKIRAYTIKDVKITDEDVQKKYDELVEADKTSYEESPSDYCSAKNNGDDLYFAPEGVRLVKQILIQYDQETRDAITAANGKVSAAQAIIESEDDTHTQEEKDQAQKDLEAAQAEVDSLTDQGYASIDAEADEVLEKLAAGEDWDALSAEHNDDPGMMAGRETAETGYAVCTGMTSFDSAFTEAAMALEKIGDTTGKIRGSSNGYYIIRYVGDVTPGEVGLEAVKEDIAADLQSEAEDAAYDQKISEWLSEKQAEFKVDMNALKD